METRIVSCDCGVCGGRKAKVMGTEKMDKTTIHNMVCLAFSPLACAESAQRFGPWKVTS